MVREKWVGVMVVAAVLLSTVDSWAVYSPSGQALKVVYAVEDALLDKVIAATEIGVRSTTTGKVAKGWGIARFAGNALGPLLTIGVSVGGVLISSYLDDWVASHDWWLEGNEIYRASGTGAWQTAPGAPGVGLSVSTAPGAYIIEVRQTAAEALAARNAKGGGGTEVACGACIYQWPPGTWACDNTGVGQWDCAVWGNYATGQVSGKYYYYMYPRNGHTEYVQWVADDPVVVSSASLESQFVTDFATDGGLARQVGADLVDYLGDKVGNANRQWPGTVPESGGYSPLSDAQGATVQQAFNDAVDAKAKENLQERADENGTMVPGGAVEGPAGSDWEYTPEQIAAAQYTKDMEREGAYLTEWGAEKPDDGNDSTIDAGAYTLPERRDLAGVLNSFRSGISSLPIVSWANGVNLTVTGASSIINLPIPAAWGSSITVDFADYENILDGMGNGLYALVGIASVLFLFRGRGD